MDHLARSTCRPRAARPGLRRLGTALAASAAVVATSTAWGWSGPFDDNASSDPHALYGGCLDGWIGAGLGARRNMLEQAGGTLQGVLAITVLQCQPFSGGGPAQRVECPPGSPYARCLRNRNDGLGNDVTLGVLLNDTRTSPLRRATGCPPGTTPPHKLALWRASGGDARRIKALVTLSCDVATQAEAAPVEVPCPKPPHPYSRCIATPNDGAGHAVTLGVVEVHGAGDPWALYGSCNTETAMYGIQPGYRPRIALVQDVGRPTDNVRVVDLATCNAPAGFGPTFPRHLVSGPCNASPFIPPWMAEQHAYCIWGTDARGNGVIAGVH